MMHVELFSRYRHRVAIAVILHDIGISISGGRIFDEFIGGILLCADVRQARERSCMLAACLLRVDPIGIAPHPTFPIDRKEHGFAGHMHTQRSNAS